MEHLFHAEKVLLSYSLPIKQYCVNAVHSMTIIAPANSHCHRMAHCMQVYQGLHNLALQSYLIFNIQTVTSQVAKEFALVYSADLVIKLICILLNIMYMPSWHLRNRNFMP